MTDKIANPPSKKVLTMVQSAIASPEIKTLSTEDILSYYAMILANSSEAIAVALGEDTAKKMLVGIAHNLLPKSLEESSLIIANIQDGGIAFGRLQKA